MLKPTCLFICFLVSSVLAKAEQSPPILFKKNQTGEIFSAAVEMTGPKHSKILLIGMVHQGPARFYQDVQHKVETWVNEGSLPAAVLHEFATCRTEVFDSKNLTPTPEAMRALRNSKIDYTPGKFILKSESEIAPLFDAFNIKKEACIVDVDGKTMRAPYYVSRNQELCRQAEAHSSACQWKALTFPESALLKNIEADIKTDEMPAGMQFATMTMFRNLDIPENDELYNYLYWPASYVSSDYRNNVLLAQASNLTNNGAARIVIPWGAFHLPDLIQSLQKMGYQKTSISDIMYTTPAEVGQWENLRLDELAGDDYGFKKK